MEWEHGEDIGMYQHIHSKIKRRLKLINRKECFFGSGVLSSHLDNKNVAGYFPMHLEAQVIFQGR